jgi:hypothetical protein
MYVVILFRRLDLATRPNSSGAQQQPPVSVLRTYPPRVAVNMTRSDEPTMIVQRQVMIVAAARRGIEPTAACFGRPVEDSSREERGHSGDLAIGISAKHGPHPVAVPV